jgi:signal transduction histidine kinase
LIADEVAGPLTDGQRQYMARILGGADILLSLINDLLDMSRINSGKFSLEIEPFELEDVVTDVIENLMPMAGQRAQTLMLQAPGRLPTVTGDPIRIRQVVMNLVGNAMKFTPEQGHITVRLAQAGNDILCEVLDTGRGVPENQRHKLFRPFSQVDMSDTRGAGGTGLGLSISKALVEAHGGQIGFESTPGIGTTVWFTLPLESFAG